jgi:hypothetical protein
MYRRISRTGFLICGVLLLSACRDTTDSATETITSQPATNATIAIPSANASTPLVTANALFGVEIGKYYAVRGGLILKSQPESAPAEPLSTEGVLANVTSQLEPYLVKESNGKYVKISTNNQNGWLPAWYLTQEKESIKDVKLQKKMVGKATPLYLYPDEEQPDSYTLTEGRIVKVKREFQVWVEVDFTLYEAAIWGDRWVRKDSLIAFDTMLAKEGLVQPGATIYNEQGEARKDSWNGAAMVQRELIFEKIGIVYDCYGPGGMHGFIQKADFIPDPFRFPGAVARSIRVDNLNGQNPKPTVKLELPLGWTWTSFSYNNGPKQYYVYNENSEQIGEFIHIGRISDSDNGFLPNHSQTKGIYTINTKFGKGSIYLLDLDLPKEERTAEHSTHMVVYTLIPIRDQLESYNFVLNVPLNEKAETYINIVEKILK